MMIAMKHDLLRTGYSTLDSNLDLAIGSRLTFIPGS